MVENHYYADVNLPNHVWVRERAGARARWVLRDASELKAGAQGGRNGGADSAAAGRKPGSSLRAR